MEVKRKDMQKNGWIRIIDKQYISKNVNIDGVSGIVSLSIWNKIKEPLYVSDSVKEIKILDNGYKWIQIALRGKHFWVTAMYDDKDNLIEIYFDITKENYFDEIDNPYFDDLFADLVISKEGDIYILDEDELEMAYQEGTIDINEYDLANMTAVKLYQYLKDNKDEIIRYCDDLRKELTREIDSDKLYLKEVSVNDGLDGLKYLQDIMHEEGIMVNPAPKDINEESYKDWLKQRVDNAKGVHINNNFIPCTTYWVMLNDKIIGLGNIKHFLNDSLLKKGGHIGLSIAAYYRKQGYGLKALRLLVDKAREEFKIEDILLTNDPENIASRNLCEKLGAELTDIDEHCHYWLRNNRK